MATIHPSRMGLVPQDMKSTNVERPRGRPPSPRRRSPSRSPSPHRSLSPHSSPSPHRSPSPRRSRRSPSPPTRLSRSRDRDRGRDDRPWRQAENMYSGRRDHPSHGRPTYGGGGAEFLESRRAQREARTVNIWPPSPKAPARELSPKRRKSSRKTKRQRSPSMSETSSDEEERRRRERKKKRSKHQRKDRSRSKAVREASPSPSRSSDKMDQDDRVAISPGIVVSSPSGSHLLEPSSGPPLSDNQDSDDDIGPQPVQKIGGKKVDERSYGGALLRGEGSAMAAFLQDGIESRIPRRGEIGLTSDQIAQYEDVGYVMSGSRHRRMNAVRMRKENQVISAEEKRGILKLQRDERERREAILREEFGELVSERLKGSASEPRVK